MKVKSIAAIDVGSNAIRLLISNIEDYDEKKPIKKHAYIRVPVRLGEDVFKGGTIGQEKIRRLIETMKAFTHLMHVFNATSYKACATSAMREAANGQEVIKTVKEKTGLEIDIVNGTEEANLIFQAGYLDEIIKSDDSYLHVDVGGGSTEVVVYSQKCKEASFSFPIGTLRILAGSVTPACTNDFLETLRGIYDQYAPVDIIASGGNINKTLKLLGRRDGDAVPLKQVENFHLELAALSFEDRLKKYKMNSYRADVIEPALHIFLTIGRACHIQNIIIPKVGLADGIVRQIHSGILSPRQVPLGAA